MLEWRRTLILPLGLDIFRPVVFLGTQIRSGASWLLYTVGQSHRTWVPGKLCTHITWLRPTFFGLQRTVNTGCYLLRQGSVYRLAPEAPIFYGNADGAQKIFGAVGRVWAKVLRPGSDIKMALCHIMVWCQINTERLKSCYLASIDFGRVSWYVDFYGCFFAFVASRSKPPDMSAREALHS